MRIHVGIKALAMASVCFMSAAALAQQTPARPAVGTMPVISTLPVFSFPTETLITGISPAPSGATSQLRLLNLGRAAGTASVSIYQASSGTKLATWTSASIASLGYLQVDVSAVIAGASPSLTAAQAAAALEFGVHGNFSGTVQGVVVAGGIASDLTNCMAGGVFGGVAGAGHTTLMSGIEFSNHGTTAQTATVTLRSAAGTTLGTWTSASIPAHSVLTVSGAAIASAATPAVPSSTVSYTAVAGGRGIGARHLSQPKAGGLVTNLSEACPIVIDRSALVRPKIAAKDAAEDGSADAGEPESAN